MTADAAWLAGQREALAREAHEAGRADYPAADVLAALTPLASTLGLAESDVRRWFAAGALERRLRQAVKMTRAYWMGRAGADPGDLPRELRELWEVGYRTTCELELSLMPLPQRAEEREHDVAA